MSYIMIEYQCTVCAKRFESLEDRKRPAATLEHCGQPAPRIISAVLGRMKMASATRGVTEPPPPHVVDTRALADGMPLREWKNKRAKKKRDARISEIRSKI